MTYNWFQVFNRTEFEATRLASKNFRLFFQGIGEVEILVTRGAYTSILYDGVFLPIEMQDVNPFEFDSHAIYVDLNDDVWLGVPVES